MKKIIAILLSIVSLFALGAFSACNLMGGDGHQHVFEDEFSFDEEKHWYACEGCDKATVKKDFHTFDDGVLTKIPTPEEDGETTYTCTVCSATKTELFEYVPMPTVSEEEFAESFDYVNCTIRIQIVTFARMEMITKDLILSFSDVGVKVYDVLLDEETYYEKTEDGYVYYEVTDDGWQYSETDKIDADVGFIIDLLDAVKTCFNSFEYDEADKGYNSGALDLTVGDSSVNCDSIGVKFDWGKLSSCEMVLPGMGTLRFEMSDYDKTEIVVPENATPAPIVPPTEPEVPDVPVDPDEPEVPDEPTYPQYNKEEFANIIYDGINNSKLQMQITFEDYTYTMYYKLTETGLAYAYHVDGAYEYYESFGDKFKFHYVLMSTYEWVYEVVDMIDEDVSDPIEAMLDIINYFDDLVFDQTTGNYTGADLVIADLPCTNVEVRFADGKALGATLAGDNFEVIAVLSEHGEVTIEYPNSIEYSPDTPDQPDLPVEPGTAMTKEQWIASFSDERYSNFTMKMWSESAGVPETVYNYIVGENWVQEIDGHYTTMNGVAGYYSLASQLSLDIKNSYDCFTYDDANDVYFATNIIVENNVAEGMVLKITFSSIKATFEGAYLRTYEVDFVSEMNGQVMASGTQNFEIYNYGTTVLPEDSGDTPEIPDQTQGMSYEAWVEYFSDDTFKNFTIKLESEIGGPLQSVTGYVTEEGCVNVTNGVVSEGGELFVGYSALEEYITFPLVDSYYLFEYNSDVYYIEEIIINADDGITIRYYDVKMEFRDGDMIMFMYYVSIYADDGMSIEGYTKAIISDYGTTVLPNIA